MHNCACNYMVYILNLILNMYLKVNVMSKIQLTKTILSFAALAMLASCSKYWGGAQKNDNMNQKPQVVQEQIVEDSDDDQYDQCNDTRFTTQRDQSQTLGYLQPGYKLPQPKHAYVYPGEHKPKVHHHKKKTKKVVKDVHEQPAKQDAYNKPQVEAAPAPAVTHETPAQAPMHTAPVTQNAPVAAASVATPAPAASNSAAAMTEQKHDAGSASHAAPTTAVAPMAPATTAPAAPTTPAPAVQPSAMMMGSVTSLNFSESEVDLSAQNMASVDKVIEDLKANATKNAKIESHAYVASGSTSDARRNSLQRAIKIRKYMIDKDIAPNRISVNAIEDANAKMNKVDISLEEAK